MSFLVAAPSTRHRGQGAAVVTVATLLLCSARPAGAAGLCALPGVSPALWVTLRAEAKGRLLCPRLLKDGALTARYVDAFPHAAYKKYTVPGSGRFYLDALDDVIKNVLREGRRWETEVHKLLVEHVKRGSTVVDAGAHIGVHSIALSRLVGPKGRVYAFEPQRKLFRELVYNMRLNQTTANVVPLRFALGAKQRLIEMDQAKKGNEGGTHVGRGGDKAELRTLDSFELERVSLLKIDVEGFEGPLLVGATQTLRRWHPPVIVEIQGGYDLDTAPLAKKLKVWKTVRWLSDHGYYVRRFGVHDYFAVYRGVGRLRAGFTRSIPAGLPRFSTHAGRGTRGKTVSTGKAGALLFGPYEYLPAGNYAVRFFGKVYAPGKLVLDIASKLGHVRHAKRTLQVVAGESGLLGSVVFSLDRAISDAEYRVFVDDNVKLTLHRVEVHLLADR